MLLSEEPPSWLGILARSSLVSECVESACFCNRILSSHPLTYTLAFSRGRVRDNLTHCVHLRKELELLQRFDSLPSHLARIVEVCYVCVPLLCFSVIC